MQSWRLANAPVVRILNRMSPVVRSKPATISGTLACLGDFLGAKYELVMYGFYNDVAQAQRAPEGRLNLWSNYIRIIE